MLVELTLKVWAKWRPVAILTVFLCSDLRNTVGVHSAHVPVLKFKIV